MRETSVSPETAEAANLLSRLDRIPITKTVRRVVALLAFAWITESFDIGIVGSVMLMLKALWKLTPNDMGLLATSSTMGIVVGLALAGVLADKFGRRLVLIFGVAWFSIFTLVGAAVPNLYWVAAMRFVAGLGEGAVFPIPYLMVSEFANAKQRGVLVGVMVAVLTGSYILPNLVGGWALSSFAPELAWRIPFLIGALPLLFVPILLKWLPESPRWLLQKGRMPDVRVMVEALEIEARLPHDTTLLDSEIVDTLSAPRQIRSRGFWMRVFKPPYLSRSIISWGIYTGALLYFYAPLVYGPTMFAQKGLNFGNATLFVGVMMLTAGFGGFAQGHLADRYGRKPVMLIYSVLAAVGFGLLGQVTSTAAMIGAGFLSAFFGIGIFPILKLYIAEQYPTELRGAGTGIGEAVSRFLGGVVATYYASYILASYGVSGVLLFVAALGTLFLVPMMLWGRETAGVSVEQAGAASSPLVDVAKRPQAATTRVTDVSRS